MVPFNRSVQAAKRLFYFAFFFTCLLASQQGFSQQAATEIHTDFSGYWKSTTASPNATYPNTSHNVLAFKAGGTTYSTGVNNATLTAQGVTYSSTTFNALPVNTINGTTTGAPLYIALASKYDGVPVGYSSPLPTVKMKDVLTDGTNGLNIGTGITNVPSSCTMSYSVQNIITAAIADAVPDFLFSQVADPSGSTDQIYFINSAGTTVGSVVTVSWGSVSALGNYYLDLYTLQNPVSCNTASINAGSSANTTREIRMTTLKLSDLGITAGNAASVAALVVKPGGQSDPAFVAYNTGSFTITTPVISGNPTSQVVCPGVGSNATFTVTANGYGLTYQWRKNGVNISGATASSYTITNVTAADAGSYDVIVTNSVGSATSNTAYLNVIIVSQPSPPAQSVVTGNSVTLTVSANNATSYQWKKDGVNISGATFASYVINPLTSTHSGSYTCQAINSGGGGCASVMSTAAVISPYVVLYSKSTGNLNSAATWGLSSDGTGSTPVDFTRAEHTFIISNRATATTFGDWTIAGTLDVSNAATTIAAGSTLDVGSLIRSGTGSLLGSSTSSLTVRGTSNLYFAGGSQELKNFTITGGTCTMLTPLSISANGISGKLSLTDGTLALSGNKITLQSRSTLNTAMVTAVGSGASINYGTGGGFIVERYVPSHRSFRFMSPAVTTTGTIRDNWMEGINNTNTSTWLDPYPGFGTHITGPGSSTNGFDATNTNNPSVFTYNNTTQTWATIPNTSVTITAGKAYRMMIRGSRAVDLSNNAAAPSTTILRTTGAITTGTVTLNSVSLAASSGKYCFVGNPYPSPISWSSLVKSGVSASYYSWDQSVGTRGAYVSFNSITGLSSNGASAVNDNIQSEQAFFVLTTSATPSLQFRESDKTISNTAVFRGNSGGVKAQLSLQLLLGSADNGNTTADGLTAIFDDSLSNDVGEEDSYKFSNLDETMGINRNGVILSIEGRKPVTANDTLPLKLWQYRLNNYTFLVNAKYFDPAVSAFLHDAWLQKDSAIDLNGKTFLPFYITTDTGSFAPNRFSIIFKASQILPVSILELHAARKENQVQLQWMSFEQGDIERYEVEKSTDGLRFKKAGYLNAVNSFIQPVNYEWTDAEPAKGANFYRIKVSGHNTPAKFSNVSKVLFNVEQNGISVFPNPVKNNLLNIQMTGNKGSYFLTLYNSEGKEIFSTNINHEGSIATYEIKTGAKLAQGFYTLQVKGNGEVFTSSLLTE